jgi:hypothetical protein
MKRSTPIFALVALLAVTFVAGCESAGYTENYRAATARTGADLAMTAAAEEAPLDAATVAAVGRVARELDAFLASGDAAALTAGELRARLEASIPAAYRPFFAAALGYVATAHVDTAAIDPEALRLARNALLGIATAAEQWEAPASAEMR